MLYRLPKVKAYFLEDRNYVQGGTIYKLLLSSISTYFGIRKDEIIVTSLKLRGFVDKCLEFIILDEGDVVENTLGDFSIEVGGNHIKGVVVYGNAEIVNRVQYDEAKIPIEITNRTGELLGSNKYHPIYNIISITKKLHEENIPIESGHWIFVQLSFVKTIEIDISCLKIEIIKVLGNRYTISNVFINDDNVGEIRFAVNE
jgi:hypothetical protein